jgi:hemerythrin-like domain-containing protein
MDLTTNGVVITDAIKYVQGQMDHLSTQEKKLLQGIKPKQQEEEKENGETNEESAQAETTTNGVF